MHTENIHTHNLVLYRKVCFYLPRYPISHLSVAGVGKRVG